MLLAQAEDILKGIVELGWQGMEGDIPAIRNSVLDARRKTAQGYFKALAAKGLFVPREDRE